MEIPNSKRITIHELRLSIEMFYMHIWQLQAIRGLQNSSFVDYICIYYYIYYIN